MDNYNEFKQKYAIWAKEKRIEEELLRKLNCKEEVISELHEYDKKIFNQERRYYTWNYELFDYTLNNIPYIYQKEILSFNDLIDVIEDYDSYMQLSKMDQFEQDIITYRLQGYTFDEIAKLLNVKPSTLYSRFKKIKKSIRISKK